LDATWTPKGTFGPFGLQLDSVSGRSEEVESGLPKVKKKTTSWHVAVAAEALAAAQFARCGFDVSIQYGANQPEYDLIVARDDQMLKVSVKGSRDGSWGLTQSCSRKPTTTAR
jgi:hypothetical protein